MSQSTSNFVTAFWGNVSSIEAELFVQANDASVAILSGHVSGPFCSATRTLSAQYKLYAYADKGPQFFKAVLPDPCFWAPGFPFLYQAEINICVSGQGETSESFPLGIRPLTIRGHDFLYAGRRYVMRIVDVPQLVETSGHQEALFDICLETGSVLFLRTPKESICQHATQKGVLLAVQVESTNPEHVLSELKQYARWPAVGMVILSADLVLGTPLDLPAASLVRAVAYRRGQKVPPWAQVLIVDENSLAADFPAGKNLPQMVFCRMESEASIAVARRVCDDLQGRTAAWPQIAGYMASSSGALY